MTCKGKVKGKFTLARFDYYVIERLLVIFGLLIMTLVTVIWINLAARGFTDFFSNTEAISLLLRYVMYEFPPSLFQSLPLAAFISSVFVTCRLYDERELNTVLSAGVSPARLLRPFAVFSVIMAVLSSILAHEILPSSLSQAAEIKIRMQADISQYRIKQGKFLFPINGVAIFVGEISETGELIDVFIHDAQSQENEITYFANTASIIQSGTDTFFEMHAGTIQVWNPESRNARTFSFDSIRLSLSELAQGISGAPPTGKYTTTIQLWKQLQLAKVAESSDIHEIKVQINRRIVYSITTAIFAIIGALAVITSETFRISQWLSVTGSTIAIVVLYLFGEFAREHTLNNETSVLLMYIPVVLGFSTLLLLIGIVQNPFGLHSFRLRSTK